MAEVLNQAVYAVKRPVWSVRLAAFHAGRIFGGRDYQRFVILGHARTGSNLLRSLLEDHPAVYVLNEKVGALRGRTIEEASAGIYRRMPPWIKAVGFKLFYYHPLDGDAAAARRWFRALPGMKVIHLRRRNLLRTIVSREIARQTSQWADVGRSESRESRDKRQVSFTASDLEERFRRIRRWERECPAEFGACPVLDVCFEELAADQDGQMRRVFDFLGLEGGWAVKTSFRRQNPEPVRALVANFDELAAAFAGTEWAAYFAEEEAA